MADEELKDPYEVYSNYEDRRAYSIKVEGESGTGGEASIEVHGELPNNVETGEDALEAVGEFLFHTVFGAAATHGEVETTMDGEPDPEACELARTEFTRRVEAINAAADVAVETSEFVVQEALRRKREAELN